MLLWPRPVPPREGSSPLGVAVPRPEFRGLSRRTIPTMDQLHRRLARLALAEAGAFGFCLAGGYAVQAHGFLDRPSEDVDLFTTTRLRGALLRTRSRQWSAAYEARPTRRHDDEWPTRVSRDSRSPTRPPAPQPRSNSASTGARTHPSRSPSAPSCTPMTPSRTRSAPSSPAPRHATSSTSTPSSAPAATPATNCSRSPKEHDPGFDEDDVRAGTARHPATSRGRVHPLQGREHRGPRAHRTNREMGGRASESVVTTAMSGHVASNDIRAEHVARTGGEDAVEAGRRARRSTSAKVASPPSPEHCDPSDAPCATSTVTSTSSAEPAAEARVRSGQVPLGHSTVADLPHDSSPHRDAFGAPPLGRIR